MAVDQTSNPRIVDTEWHGMKAVLLEGQRLRAVFVPELGAKMVSLVDPSSGHEWLVGPGGRRLQPVAYGATFVDQDMSGWDEMFPTIDPCAVEMTGEQQPITLPDHGEVWALPWDVTTVPGALRFEVMGVALPYRLARTVRLTEPSVMRFDYEVTNLGIWVDEGTYNTVPTVALEPATGYYDEVVLAQRLGRAPVIAPGETHRWWLEIRLG